MLDGATDGTGAVAAQTRSSYRGRCDGNGRGVSLYTILPSLILYGVWHTQGGVVEGSCIAQ